MRHLRPDRARARREGALFRLRGSLGVLHGLVNDNPKDDHFKRKLRSAIDEIATLEKRLGTGPFPA